MTDQTSTPEDAPSAVASAEPNDDTSPNCVQPPTRSPYLKVFGADLGLFEFDLLSRIVTIGRAEDNDLTLPNPSVSRTHAAITRREGQLVLTDSDSAGGTTVNGKRCKSHALEHGDSIQIANYVLQFRTHDALPGAKEAAEQAKLHLRGDYCMLPSTIRLRFRALEVDPSSIFATGDTLKVGQGGLLIPTSIAPGDDECLELHLTVALGAAKRFLGEIMGVLTGEETEWLCVKLHSVPRDVHEDVVNGAAHGPWIDVLPT